MIELYGFEHLIRPDGIDPIPFWSPWPSGDDYVRVAGAALTCPCGRRADTHGYHVTMRDEAGDRLTRLCSGRLVKL